MAVDRLTISVPLAVAAAVRRAAEVEDVSVSAWIVDAIQARLDKGRDTEGWAELIADYEAEFGVFTEEELAAARRRLGW